MRLIFALAFVAILGISGGESIAADNQRSFAKPSVHHANSHNLRDVHGGFHRTSRAVRAFNKMRWRAKAIRHKGGLAPKRSAATKNAFARSNAHKFKKGIGHHRVRSRKGLKSTARIWHHRIPHDHDADLVEVGFIDLPIDQAIDHQDLGVATVPDRHLRTCWQTSKVVQQEEVKIRHVAKACRETRRLISITPISQQVIE